MDKLSRNYSIGIGIIIILTLFSYFYENPEVSELNDLLEADSAVASYPYQFHVMELKNEIAVMSTPRSTDFPVQRALGLLYPNLANRKQNNPDLMKAQQKLATVQKQAKALVLSSPKVKSVRWELDKKWLSQYGISLGVGY